jgi:hypothetical protein
MALLVLSRYSILAVIVTCILIAFLSLRDLNSDRVFLGTANPFAKWEFNVLRDESNYGLSTVQCDAAFPLLFQEISKSTARRRDNPITLEELESVEMKRGMVRVVIYNNDVSLAFSALLTI